MKKNWFEGVTSIQAPRSVIALTLSVRWWSPERWRTSLPG